MSTKYLARLSNEDLLALIRLLSPSAQPPVSIISKAADSYMVKVQSPIVDEGEELFIDDLYSMTDYDISPYEWGGNIYEEIIKYRKAMYRRFGEEYALDYLFDTAGID